MLISKEEAAQAYAILGNTIKAAVDEFIFKTEGVGPSSRIVAAITQFKADLLSGEARSLTLVWPNLAANEVSYSAIVANDFDTYFTALRAVAEAAPKVTTPPERLN